MPRHSNKSKIHRAAISSADLDERDHLVRPARGAES
jgi:hypothetical protein